MNQPQDNDNFKISTPSTRTPFTAEIERQEHFVLFKLHGDLDIDGSLLLRNIFDARVQDDDLFVVFDMSKITYINSAGIGAIIALSKKVLGKKGRLFLVNTPNKIKNIFEIAELDFRLTFVDSIEKALKIIKEK